MSLDDYEVLEEGAFRSVARRRSDGRRVVIKELAMGRLSDWKELELFDRQASVLQQLDHPRIPKVIDSFEGEGDSPTFYLVCEYLGGTPLRDAIGTLDESQLQRVALDVLETLEYLQSFSPPVLHRNITVDTILLHDGRASLVDFGAVQVELRGTMGGSTVVGTSGYMPPEQLLGRATASSDLYALGASLVHAVTEIEPAMLPAVRMKLRWRAEAKLGSDSFCAWLDRMIEPDEEQRFVNASDAIHGLGGTENLAPEQGLVAQRPAQKRIQLRRGTRKLEVQLPAPKLGYSVVVGLIALVAAFVLPVLNISLWSVFLVPTVCAGIVFWSGRDVWRWWTQRGGSSLVLELDRGYRLLQGGETRHSGSLADIVEVQTGFLGRTDCLWLCTEDEMIPTSGGLQREEVEWLRRELRDFLQIRDPRDWVRDYLSTQF